MKTEIQTPSPQGASHSSERRGHPAGDENHPRSQPMSAKKKPERAKPSRSDAPTCSRSSIQNPSPHTALWYADRIVELERERDDARRKLASAERREADQILLRRLNIKQMDEWREKAEHLAIQLATGNDAIESLTRDLWTVIEVARRNLARPHGTIERIAANLPANV
jgi:hypothetical protein